MRMTLRILLSTEINIHYFLRQWEIYIIQHVSFAANVEEPYVERHFIMF